MSDDVQAACTPRVALVTGSGRGIGLACARRLAEAGFNICFNCSSEGSRARTEEAARAISEDTGVSTCVCVADVANAEDAERMVATCAQELGSIDVLVNNAGITRDKLVSRMSEEDFDAVIDVNLKGTFNCSKSAAKRMMKQRHGRIINMSSVVGVFGNAGQAA